MTSARRKTHRTGTRPDLRVPFTEVTLGDSPDGAPNDAVLLYDTSGPGADPTLGLPALRSSWIEESGDTVQIEGRTAEARADREEERRTGKTSVRTCSSRRWPYT